MASLIPSTETIGRDAGQSRIVRAVSDALAALVYPDSISVAGPFTFAMIRRGLEKSLLVVYEGGSQAEDFVGESCPIGCVAPSQRVKLCPLTRANAAALRRHLPFTAPVTLGPVRSIGTGDRLGLATPGHIAAVRHSAVRPVLAQQSMREMKRTGRAASQVLDDVTWAVLQTGYRGGFGADADHLKTVDDLAACLDLGFTMYTIDPSDHVDSFADQADFAALESRFMALPWSALRSSAGACLEAYTGRTVQVEGADGGFELRMTTEDLVRAAVKYGRAIAHTAAMYEYLVGRLRREEFEFEVSVDETEAATSPAEHFCIASEMKRLGIRCDSLAPHFVGRFPKGVDYIGDLEQFRAEFARHVLIAQHCGPYKISLHSGSDKFALYPTVAELAGELIHVKTAGTSYLEALRVVAQVAPDVFRDMLTFARGRYPHDRVTYCVDVELAKVPDPAHLRDEELPEVLNQRDARQVCHVTYGSVLTARHPDGNYRFRDRLFATLRSNEELHYSLLKAHFDKHLSPFA